MSRRVVFSIVLIVAPLLLFGVPWWVVVFSGDWPVSVTVAGSVLAVVSLLALPVSMRLGHFRPGNDVAARIGDTLLGLVWLLFSWSVLGLLARIVLMLAGVPGLVRCRSVAIGVLAVVAVLAVVGHWEAMRVPRVRTREVSLPRLGAGFDGIRVVVLADTHFGPIDRRSWAAKLVSTVNGLHADVVCHVGDLADGTVAQRRAQVDTLGEVRAKLGKYYITGNHEYFSQAQRWLDHMADLGWTPLHNRHQTLTRAADRLIIAGIDDPAGTGSGLAGHGPDLTAALAGADTGLPVILLAHQPKQIERTAGPRVDLQLSGHTHGGQIWPFHYLVRLEQRALRGLTRHGDTQLYTSGGSGFWGPPFRVFAPSEVTLLILRARPR
jgi:uncharacterized protein